MLPIAAWSVLAVFACAHPQARTQPERPALIVPEPPERTIAPPPPEEPPPATSPQPDAAAQKPARPRPAQPKPEPPVTPPAPPVTQNPTAAAAPSTLQTTPPANQAELIKNIRELLSRAHRDLKGVVYDSLNADGKAQYDTARRFADQAEQALKDMNLVFALTLADKAATLARSLAGRAPDTSHPA